MNLRTLIPCAGLGTRAKMKYNESKELLLFEGIPLIEHALSQSINPLVITRIEKEDLIEYCSNHGVDTLILDEPTKEWPETILKSESQWEEDNVILLPDTIFTPFKVVEGLGEDLRETNYAFAVHKVKDPTKWGIISDDFLIEKPTHLEGLQQEFWAWGLMGFKKDHGKLLLQCCLEKKPLKMYDYSMLFLNTFKDVTRG